MRTTWPMVAMLSLLAAWCGGCQETIPKDKFDKLNQQWVDTLRENRDLARRNEQMEEAIGRQNDQIAQLQNLGDKRLEKLYYVTGLEMGRRSGGIDTDGKTGDDAVIVYLQPVDQYGHVIKAAGEVTLQLFDLANTPAENLIGEFRWSLDELGSTWAGGFLGNSQFSLPCPWPPNRPPAHEQVTIRATFTDYLTGKAFTAQKAVTVRLPSSLPPPPPDPAESQSRPSTKPSSQPTSDQAD